MGLVKKTAEDISYALGLEGEITADVESLTERLMSNCKNEDRTEQVMEIMRIAREMRKVRERIEWGKVQEFLSKSGL